MPKTFGKSHFILNFNNNDEFDFKNEDFLNRNYDFEYLIYTYYPFYSWQGRGKLVFKKFRDTCPDIVPKRMIGNEPMTVKVPLDYMEKLPELKENPFRRRICEVFSRDGKGHLTFEDLLDLLSAFSEQAPRDIKVFYAFKIYDFDGDRYIGITDLEQAARLLTRNELSAEEISQIAEKVIEEADVDGDGKLSYMEFEHVILRAPDFLTTFHIRI